jgi:hypothetical protein
MIRLPVIPEEGSLMTDLPAAPAAPMPPAPSSRYPVRVDFDYVEQRSRVKTFFRGILFIPAAIVAYVIGIVMGIFVIISWFAIVFTGRHPRGLFDSTATFFRWITRTQAYYMLLTDEYPPFNGNP